MAETTEKKAPEESKPKAGTRQSIASKIQSRRTQKIKKK